MIAQIHTGWTIVAHCVSAIVICPAAHRRCSVPDHLSHVSPFVLWVHDRTGSIVDRIQTLIVRDLAAVPLAAYDLCDIARRRALLDVLSVAILEWSIDGVIRVGNVHATCFIVLEYTGGCHHLGERSQTVIIYKVRRRVVSSVDIVTV